MKRLLPLVLLLASLTTSCGRNIGDTSLYHSSGRSKPIVAVVPMIDSTQGSRFQWDLAKELTAKIQKRVFQSSKLYLLRQDHSSEISQSLNKMDVRQIPAEAIESLGAAEFAIVTELLDQSEKAYGTDSDVSKVGGLFTIAMRVRILDLRGNTPTLVLQEVIDHDHVIPRFYVGCDYEQSPWGSPGFERTPMGMAHNRIVKELIAHAEGYIGVSKG